MIYSKFSRTATRVSYRENHVKINILLDRFAFCFCVIYFALFIYAVIFQNEINFGFLTGFLFVWSLYTSRKRLIALKNKMSEEVKDDNDFIIKQTMLTNNIIADCDLTKPEELQMIREMQKFDKNLFGFLAEHNEDRKRAIKRIDDFYNKTLYKRIFKKV